MDYKILGDVMQALQLNLHQGEEIYAEAGAMLYMGPGIDFQAKMQGGLMKGLMRKFLAGESMFMSVFRCDAPQGHMALANPIAGKIFPIELRGNTILAERNAYLCAIGHVDLSIAFTKRFGSGLFFQASGDMQWRDELRSADIPDWGSTSPLSADPIGVGPQLSISATAPNRQKTTGYGVQLSGHYSFKYDVGIGLNYRFQSGFPYSLYIPDGTVNLNVCNFNCAFFATNLDQNRSEAVNLMNFRIDKAFRLGGAKKATLMLDIYNLLNADPVTNFNLSATSPRTVIAVLDPRVFQMGFRFEF